jgi:hypothetical protein
VLFKLIIQRYKFPQIEIHNPQTTGEGPKLPDHYGRKLYDIYQENQIYTIGFWQDVDDPRVEYVLNVYKDEQHYNEFIKKMAENVFYRELSRRMTERREWIKIVTLKLDGCSPIQPDLVGIQGYIDMVRNLTELRAE